MAESSTPNEETSAPNGENIVRSHWFRSRPAAIMAVAAGLTLAVMGLLPNLSAPLQTVLTTPTTQPFNRIDDFNTQYRELVEYLTRTGHLRQINQVDLATHRKISQFIDIDSSPQVYGPNACGLVAAAAALGGDNWTPLVARIAQAAGVNYQPDSGIQPSKYIAALQQVFGVTKTQEMSGGSLGELYQALAAGNVVIVDIKVNELIRAPSAQPPHYAHFARVLGLDVDRQVIYLENTLRGDPYWTISLADFWEAWKHPETSASIVLDPRHAEDVTRWAVILSNTLIPKPAG